MYCSRFFENDLIKFHPQKNIISAFRELASLIKCDSSIDRSNFTTHPLCIQRLDIPESRNISLEQCMYEQATYVANFSNCKKVLWSGGIDSTAALISIMLYDNNFDYNIICTTSSIEEYPWFYDKYVSKMRHSIETSNPNDFYNKVFDGSAVITGQLGDHLFFDYLTIEHKHILLDSPWEVLKLFVNKEKDTCVNMLDIYARNSPIGIKTVEDMYWWLKFIFDWHADFYKPSLVLNKPSNISDHIPFYGSNGFQSWALHNYHSIKISTWDNMSNHKQPLKQYIFDFTKDEQYLNNKQKQNSFKLAFGNQTMMFKHHCLYDNYETPDLKYFLKDCYDT